MRLESQCRPVFARHETFFPRYGWFRKAVSAARRDPAVFTRDDATIELGVGKNMVRAIRFWAQAAKLIEPVRGIRNAVRPTDVGLTFFGESNGAWDPYVEDPATLWWLHWKLLAGPCELPVWWSLFNNYTGIEFRDVDAMRFLAHDFEVADGWNAPPSASLRKDLDCLLRMYVARSGGRSAEEAVDCPFRQLGIVDRVVGSEQTFRFANSIRPTLPPEVVTAASLDFLGADRGSDRTALLARLATTPGAPCRVFKLTEDELVTAITTVCERLSPALQVQAPGGAPQLVFRHEPGVLAWAVLLDYYKRLNPNACFPSPSERGDGGVVPGHLPFGEEWVSQVREVADSFGHEGVSRRSRQRGKKVFRMPAGVRRRR